MTADNMPNSESSDDSLDFLDDLDMTRKEESNDEVMAALDHGLQGLVFDEPTVPKVTPLWLTDAQEYAVKHGPFSTDQIVSIIRALHAVPDPLVEWAR